MEGDAEGEQLFALDSPVAGDQEQDAPPEPVKGVENPAFIVADPDATAVGNGFTVTVVVAEVDEHPTAFVTVTVKLPPLVIAIVRVVAPLDHW